MTPFEQETVYQANINLLIQIFIALGAFIVAALAIWGDRLKAVFFAPKLEVTVHLEPPYCQRMPQGTWFRLNVSNDSRTAAQEVQLWIVELRRGTNGNSILLGLVPIPLQWTHGTSTSVSINPQFNRYCEFGVLTNPTPTFPTFHLLTSPVPNDGTTDLGASSYYAHVVCTASNSRPKHFYVCFEVPNYQPPTEAEALNIVRLRLVERWSA